LADVSVLTSTARLHLRHARTWCAAWRAFPAGSAAALTRPTPPSGPQVAQDPGAVFADLLAPAPTHAVPHTGTHARPARAAAANATAANATAANATARRPTQGIAQLPNNLATCGRFGQPECEENCTDEHIVLVIYAWGDAKVLCSGSCMKMGVGGGVVMVVVVGVGHGGGGGGGVRGRGGGGWWPWWWWRWWWWR